MSSLYRLFLVRQQRKSTTLSSLTGVLLARCRRWGKNPHFRGPCDRLSHRAKIGDFFPKSETCQRHHRKMVSLFNARTSQNKEKRRSRKLKSTAYHSSFIARRTFCLRRESLWPGDPGGPLGGAPRGGYYIDDPDPFWTPIL